VHQWHRSFRKACNPRYLTTSNRSLIIWNKALLKPQMSVFGAPELYAHVSKKKCLPFHLFLCLSRLFCRADIRFFSFSSWIRLFSLFTISCWTIMPPAKRATAAKKNSLFRSWNHCWAWQNRGCLNTFFLICLSYNLTIEKIFSKKQTHLYRSNFVFLKISFSNWV